MGPATTFVAPFDTVWLLSGKGNCRGRPTGTHVIPPPRAERPAWDTDPPARNAETARQTLGNRTSIAGVGGRFLPTQERRSAHWPAAPGLPGRTPQLLARTGLS